MGFLLTKMVKLVWDGVNWRDFETSILVTGVLPPYPADSAAYSGECVKAPEPLQFVEGGLPFKRSETPIVDRYGEEWLSPPQHAAVLQMIDKVITERSVPEQLVYFVEGDWLITYAYHRETVQAFSHEINQLERRIEKLERPWWKRW